MGQKDTGSGSTVTEFFIQFCGLGQGPTNSPDKFNWSLHPLQDYLERGGGGIKVGNLNTLGTAWSDDNTLLIKESNMDTFLKALVKASGHFKKKINEDKTFFMPTMNKPAGQDWPKWKLGGEELKQAPKQ